MSVSVMILNYWNCPLWYHILSLVQSYGIEHLLTFANLRQLGLLEEQQAGETLTVMESKVGKLVTDKTVGENVDECNLSFTLFL